MGVDNRDDVGFCVVVYESRDKAKAAMKCNQIKLLNARIHLYTFAAHAQVYAILTSIGETGVLLAYLGTRWRMPQDHQIATLERWCFGHISHTGDQNSVELTG